jgi:hydrogenase maturation factor
VGFALSVVDEDEANRIFEDLKRLGELADLEERPE